MCVAGQHHARTYLDARPRLSHVADLLDGVHTHHDERRELEKEPEAVGIGVIADELQGVYFRDRDDVATRCEFRCHACYQEQVVAGVEQRELHDHEPCVHVHKIVREHFRYHVIPLRLLQRQQVRVAGAGERLGESLELGNIAVLPCPCDTGQLQHHHHHREASCWEARSTHKNRRAVIRTRQW